MPKAPSTPTPELPPLDVLCVKVEEAARMLSIGRTTAYEQIAAGRIPVVRFGRDLRVNVEALRVMLRRNTQWAEFPEWAEEADNEPTYIHAPRQRA